MWKVDSTPRAPSATKQTQRQTAATRAGLTSGERERLKALERENLELRRANEILRKASAYLAQAERGLPPCRLWPGGREADPMGRVRASAHAQLGFRGAEVSRPVGSIRAARAAPAPSASSRDRCYAPRVDGRMRMRTFPRGNARASLNKLTLMTGTVVAVKAQPVAENGDVVFARLDDEVTPKCYHHENERHVVLCPKSTNPDHQPIRIDLKTDAFEIAGRRGGRADRGRVQSPGVRLPRGLTPCARGITISC